jgi:hypothetical protein
MCLVGKCCEHAMMASSAAFPETVLTGVGELLVNLYASAPAGVSLIPFHRRPKRSKAVWSQRRENKGKAVM